MKQFFSRDDKEEIVKNFSKKLGHYSGSLVRILGVVTMVMAMFVGVAGQALGVATQVADVTVDAVEAFRGDTFTVAVRIDGAADPIKGYEFEMNWDPDVVTIHAVQAGDLLTDPLSFATINAAAGTLGFAALAETAAVGDGTLAVISGQATGMGQTGLLLAGVAVQDPNNAPIPVNVAGGLARSIVVDVDPAFTADPEWVGLGTTFTEDIRLHGTPGVRGFEFELHWDPAIVGNCTAELGDLIVTDPELVTVIEEDDMLSFVALSPTAATEASGVLATVTCDAVGAGESPLDLQNVMLVNAEAGAVPPAALGDGRVLVTESVVQVTPEESLVMLQDQFEVDVTASIEQALGGFEMRMTYNPDIVTVDDVTVGDDVSDDEGCAFGWATPGLITAQCLALDGSALVPAGGGNLMTVALTASGVGQSDLDVIDAGEAVNPIDRVLLFDQALNPLPDPEVIDGIVDVTKRAVSFGFAPIAEQTAGEPFGIAIQALTEDDDVAHYFGTADLSDLTGTLEPTATAPFNAGTTSLQVTITKAMEDVTIEASATDPVTDELIEGTSNPFDVIANVPHTLTLEADPTMLMVGETSTLTASAVDAYDNPVNDGTEVEFQTDLGLLNGGEVLTATTTAGVATAALTSDEVGEATVTATAGDASDQVSVTFVAPEITVSPAALTATLLAGETGTETLTVGNAGGADLIWEFAEIDVDWLSLEPTDGTVEPGDTIDVVVTFDATDLTGGETVTTTLVITSNDPDQGVVEVPVTLHVEVSEYLIFLPMIAQNWTP